MRGWEEAVVKGRRSRHGEDGKRLVEAGQGRGRRWKEIVMEESRPGLGKGGQKAVVVE